MASSQRRKAGFGRGYLLRAYGVIGTRYGIRAVVTEAIVCAHPPTDRRHVLARAEVDELFATVEEVCRGAGAVTVEIAADPAARERIWKGRKAAFAAMGRVSVRPPARTAISLGWRHSRSSGAIH